MARKIIVGIRVYQRYLCFPRGRKQGSKKWFSTRKPNAKAS